MYRVWLSLLLLDMAQPWSPRCLGASPQASAPALARGFVSWACALWDGELNPWATIVKWQGKKQSTFLCASKTNKSCFTLFPLVRKCRKFSLVYVSGPFPIPGAVWEAHGIHKVWRLWEAPPPTLSIASGCHDPHEPLGYWISPGPFLRVWKPQSLGSRPPVST